MSNEMVPDDKAQGSKLPTKPEKGEQKRIEKPTGSLLVDLEGNPIGLEEGAWHRIRAAFRRAQGEEGNEDWRYKPQED